jgi:antitoxin YefM
MATEKSPTAELMTTGDPDPLEETLAILGDSETVRRLLQSDAERDQGQEATATELATSIRQRD